MRKKIEKCCYAILYAITTTVGGAYGRKRVGKKRSTTTVRFSKAAYSVSLSAEITNTFPYKVSKANVYCVNVHTRNHSTLQLQSTQYKLCINE